MHTWSAYTCACFILHVNVWRLPSALRRIGYLELSQVLECDDLIQFAALVPNKKAKSQDAKDREVCLTDDTLITCS